MKYLRIENPGVAPADSFTILGVSTARNSETAIGQFGSGAKHGIVTCLRHGLEPIVCLGTRKLHFYGELRTSRLGTYTQVCFKDGNRKRETSMSLGFGELDWTKVSMGLREFISNALDAVDGNWDEISLEIVDSPRAKSGTTRVYVPVTPDVSAYLVGIRNKFLHSRGIDAQNTRIVEKAEPSSLRLYRQGVFVNESDLKSRFDYNGDASLEIDESRNLDSDRIRAHCAQILSNDEDKLRLVMREFVDGQKYAEHDFSYWYLNSWRVLNAFDHEFGETTFYTESEIIKAKCSGRGRIIVVPDGYAKCLRSQAGDRDATLLMTKAESHNVETKPASPECQRTLDKVWELLVDIELTRGKSKPTIRQFVSIVENNAQIRGYWERGKSIVYVCDEDRTNFQTILEEVGHYVTEASDETRDFQDFWIRALTRLADIVYN